MKRSAALASLSRDHHQALVIAAKLRRAGEQTAPEARQAFLDYWAAHGRAHLRVEEEMLLPAYAAHGNPYHPLALGVLGDHIALRQRASMLAAPGALPLDALHELGRCLATHVRLEERELLPMIERAMPPADLAAVARSLEDADAS